MKVISEFQMTSFFYDYYIKLLTQKFKEDIKYTEFISLIDVFVSNKDACNVKNYLIQCTQEVCPKMDLLFIDIFLSVYYKTTEPIDITRLLNLLGRQIKQQMCMHNGKCITHNMKIINIKPNVNYKSQMCQFIVSKDTDDILCNVCRHVLNGGVPVRIIVTPVTITTPEAIEFMFKNPKEVFPDKTMENSKLFEYVDYYEYMERCMHPGKLGTIKYPTIAREENKKESSQGESKIEEGTKGSDKNTEATNKLVKSVDKLTESIDKLLVLMNDIKQINLN